MYKLLLVTDEPAVLEAHEAVQTWEEFGFRKPRTVRSAAEAIEALSSHRTDALAMALPDDEKKTLLAALTEHFPILPLADAGSTEQAVLSGLQELEELLDALTGDFSNDGFSRQDMMQFLRHNFFRQLLGGGIRDEAFVRRRMQLLRSRMDPDRPCVVVDLAADQADDFLIRRWHYGNERLETALRNFFGAELDGMRILISVMEDGRIRMLCCPMSGAEVRADSITAEVYDHTLSNIEHVREYLGMELRMTDITVLNRITDLCDSAS